MRFMLDSLYCKRCPDRLQECLKVFEGAFRMHIQNEQKLLIIEFAAYTESDFSKKNRDTCWPCWNFVAKACPLCRWKDPALVLHDPCIRCHKGGCSRFIHSEIMPIKNNRGYFRCYERVHRNCSKVINKVGVSYYAENRNRQRRNLAGKRNRYVGIAGTTGQLHHREVQKWALHYEIDQEKKWKHKNW